MKQVTLSVASKDYTITLDEEFAKSFEKDIQRFLNEQKGMDIKELLSAFVQKCYETYLQEKQIENINKSITDKLNFKIENQT